MILMNKNKNAAARQNRRICLSFPQETYDETVSDDLQFRLCIDEMISQHPELFPPEAEAGWRTQDSNISKKITRGPGSALYGTGAFLGVINIITKEGGHESSRVSFEGGSFDTAKSSAELSLKNDRLKTYMYAEHYRTDGYDGTVESDRADILPIFAPSASREMTDRTEYCTFQTVDLYKHYDTFCQIGRFYL